MRSLRKYFVFLLFLPALGKAQIDTLRYFESYFETLNDQLQWTSLPADNEKKWIYQEGGLDHYNPDTAYNGELNAFYNWGDPESYSRMLVSKQINLSDSRKPELSFAYATLPDVFGLHKLYLLIRTGPSAAWDTVASYTTPANWTRRTYNITDFGQKYLTSTFQVAFLGVSGGGHGVCVDNVIIEEKEAIERFVKSVDADVVRHDLIPSGAQDIPLMRVNINIVGNTGSQILNSITFASGSSNDSLFSEAGFELVAVQDSIYRPVLKNLSLKIGSPVSIDNGQVTFTGLNYELPTGYTGLFLVADIKPTAPHGSIAGFSLASNSINISNVTYPSSAYNPSLHNTIEHSVLFEGFEAVTDWTIQNDFETATPKGFIAHTTSDPDFAYSGSKVLGTDLTTDGKYRLNISGSSAYYATSPEINLRYYDDVKLSFKKWIAFEGNDEAVIEVSTDTAKTWQRIWDSRTDALTPDNEWTDLTFTAVFDDIASRKPWVQIRFGVIYSDNSFAYAGFNIDNFAVTGKYLTNDVGIVKLTAPVDDCHNPGKDSVRITIRNYADSQTADEIPVFFSIDGTPAHRVTEVIHGPIPRDGTVDFTFSSPASFPEADVYDHFTAGIVVSGDQDSDNDSIVKSMFIQESVSLPDIQTFETKNGHWRVYGEDATWQCKTPEGSIPPLPGSQKSWILSPFGNYINGDTSWLESSCYDLATGNRSVFEMDLWLDSEPGKDGSLVEYTVDEGENWHLLGPNERGVNWNWYNSDVAALDTTGWSGINTAGWIKVRQLLPPSLSMEQKVKFKVKWAADEDNSFRGMAFDNVKVYEAPADIGVTAIDSFSDACLFVNPDILKITIKNLGVNRLSASDTILAGFDLNGATMEIDTILLESDLLKGDSLIHTFGRHVELPAPGMYTITAYTLGEKDPFFYNDNNDTLSLDFEVYGLPVVTMSGDTIRTHIPDTVVLKPYFDPDYEYLWHFDNSSDPVFNVPHEGMYGVKVTENIYGCIREDSAYVELLFNDTGIDSLINPSDYCGLKNDHLVVSIKNFGTDSIKAGENIDISYVINTGPVVTETFTTSRTILKGDTAVFRFSGETDLYEKGFYDFRIYTSFTGDTVFTNDTLKKQIEVYGHPVADLGPDVTVPALTYELDAGPGYTSYLWSSGTSGRTYTLDESGEYWVEVRDENNCEDRDTINVRLRIRDITALAFSSPVSDCGTGNNEPVTLKIFNSGTDTVPSGTDINVSVAIGVEAPAGELLTLSEDLLPGQFTEHTFAVTADLPEWGDYHFTGTAVTENDMRTWNDTLRAVVYRYDAPVVSLGTGDAEYVYDTVYVIDAGYHEHYLYDWQDDSSRYAYTVTSGGTYSVKVTDSRTSCFGRDTLTVFLIYDDVGVTLSDIGDSGCSGVYSDVKVRVTNLGTTNLGKDMPIYVGCKVNGVLVARDTLVRSGNFAPGTYLDLPFTAGIPVDDEGANDIRFYTIFNGDKKLRNDTLEIPFTILPGPVVDFGDTNGVLHTDLPHGLDAGEGNMAYLWQDGYSGRIYNVVASGTYSVTVTGMNGCTTFRSVVINPASGGKENREEITLKIYPNPSRGLVTLEGYSDEMKGINISVYNMQGGLVYYREYMVQGRLSELMDLQDLPPGIYYLMVSDPSSLPLNGTGIRLCIDR